jgi:hypothetical protein
MKRWNFWLVLTADTLLLVAAHGLWHSLRFCQQASGVGQYPGGAALAAAAEGAAGALSLRLLARHLGRPTAGWTVRVVLRSRLT